MQPAAYDKAVKQMDASKLTAWADLARALVRPLATLGSLAFVGYLAWVGVEEARVAMIAMANAALLYWFGTRKASNG